jgi:hypothetical protein
MHVRFDGLSPSEADRPQSAHGCHNGNPPVRSQPYGTHALQADYLDARRDQK